MNARVERAAGLGTGPPRRATRRRVDATVVALLLLAGLALARFAVYDQPPAPGAALRTPEEEIARLERAAHERPTDVRTWQALGVGYVRRAAQGGDPSFYDLAERTFDRADTLAPGAPDTVVGRGVLALSLHDFPQALRLGQKAHAANRLDADALGVLVDAEVELGRYGAAVRHLQQMLDRNPDLAALSRASYLRELYGQSEAAVEAMQQAERAGSAPGDRGEVAALLGDLHVGRGELDLASAAYERAQRAAPGLLAAELGQARILAARGSRTEAITRLQDVVDRNPAPAAATLLGELQLLEGRGAEAATTFELVHLTARLQQTAGGSTDLEMALFEADHGNPQTAERLARRAFAARPDNIYAADALAWALHRAGRSAAAVPLVERALRLGTANALLRYHAAAILDAVGDVGPARVHLRAAYELTPWFSFAHQHRARALGKRLGVPSPPEWGAR